MRPASSEAHAPDVLSIPPFAIFWPLPIVCTTVLMLVYVHLMARGTVGIDIALLAKKGAGKSPFNTMHMWFIYYLIWFCVFSAALAPAWGRASATLRAVVIGFGALVYSLPIGVLPKMLLNITATTVVSLLTYQLFVRHTFIGVLLNGRRQPKAKGLAAPVPAGQV